MCEAETGDRYFEDMELHTIELVKFEKLGTKKTDKIVNRQEELQLLAEKVKTSLDRWAAFLTKHKLLQDKSLPKGLKTPQLEKALDILEVMNFSKEERASYEDHLKTLRIQNSAINSALKKGMEKGLAEGLEKGLAEGLEKGLEIGEQRGIQLGIEKMVENMFSQGMDANLITKLSGLTINQIEKIIQKREVEMVAE